jgi:hypothetical protein
MDSLPILYQRIAGMTASACRNSTGECGKFTDSQYRCCERQYCEMARKFAKEKYGVDLRETDNPDLPFMGETGCVVPPHLRPVCSLHVCTWSYAPKSSAPEGYERLRSEILAEATRQCREPF